MREIKFRVWDKQIKYMMPVVDIGWDNGIITDVVAFDDVDSYDYAYDSTDIKDRLVLMQYTGLKDCNGTEIYEGDIVVKSYINPMTDKAIKDQYTVIFEDGCFKTKHTDHPFGSTFLYFLLDNIGRQKIDIIGNIYENPELLEVAK